MPTKRATKLSKAQREEVDEMIRAAVEDAIANLTEHREVVGFWQPTEDPEE